MAVGALPWAKTYKEIWCLYASPPVVRTWQLPLDWWGLWKPSSGQLRRPKPPRNWRRRFSHIVVVLQKGGLVLAMCFASLIWKCSNKRLNLNCSVKRLWQWHVTLKQRPFFDIDFVWVCCWSLQSGPGSVHNRRCCRWIEAEQNAEWKILSFTQRSLSRPGPCHLPTHTEELECGSLFGKNLWLLHSEQG